MAATLAPAAAAPARDYHGALDPVRLAAAATLVAWPVGPGQYRVTGGAATHYVDLGADGAALPKCDCGDALWRPQFVCKHRLCAYAAEGDATIVYAIRDAVSDAVAALRKMGQRRTAPLPPRRRTGRAD